MPIYVYKCNKCEHGFETMQGVNDPSPKCPECGGKVTKQVTCAQLHMRYSLMHPRHMRGQRKKR